MSTEIHLDGMSSSEVTHTDGMTVRLSDVDKGTYDDIGDLQVTSNESYETPALHSLDGENPPSADDLEVMSVISQHCGSEEGYENFKNTFAHMATDSQKEYFNTMMEQGTPAMIGQMMSEIYTAYPFLRKA